MGVRLVKYGQWKASEGGIGIDSHEMLLNRELPDQHPIDSITGLRDALDKINSKTSNSNILKIHQYAHHFSLGNVVYLGTDGLYKLAFGEDSERIEVIGIVTEIIDKDNFIITISGGFETNIFDKYPDGTVLYLSDINNEYGMLTDNPKYYIKPIATKIINGILINIQRANMYNEDTACPLFCTTEEVLDAINKLWDNGGD